MKKVENRKVAKEYAVFMSTRPEIGTSLDTLLSFLAYNWPDKVQDAEDILQELQSIPLENMEIWEGVEVISTYSRAQALDDGVLVDKPVNAVARRLGIKFHTAMTWALLERVCGREDAGELTSLMDVNLEEMIRSFKDAARRHESEQLLFSFTCTTNSSDRREMEVKVIIGPGDDAKPVLTFMLPDED